MSGRNFLTVLVVIPAILSAAVPDLTIENFTDEALVVKWQLDDLRIDPVTGGADDYRYLAFDRSAFTAEPGKPQIPYREFLVAVPEGSEVTAAVEPGQRKSYRGIRPAPVYGQSKDKNGITVYSADIDQSGYSFQPAALVDISPVLHYRDLPVVQVRFYPVSYDDSRREVSLIRTAVIRFRFKNGRTAVTGVPRRSAIDDLYKERVINFEQGRQWLAARPRQLKKPSAVPAGPWYRMEIRQEGICKISRNTLVQAGIDVVDLDPRTIRIFNHGGNPLEIRTDATPVTDLGPQENAILVTGESDGRFDEGDYIIFYARGAGGWTYNAGSNTFAWDENPYDTKNFYWLTFGGEAGKRMQQAAAPAGGVVATDTWFTEKIRLEEDKYNLLASGNDWYGNRFFGLSGTYTTSAVLDPLAGTAIPARFRIKVKAGNGIKWLDPLNKYYYFTVYINPDRIASPVLVNSQLPSRVSRTFETSVISADYLISGSNSFKIDYRGNYQDCNAYLDWIELYYPKALTAKNNMLFFYSNTTGGVVNYSISGFSAGEPLVMDVTDPKNVSLLATDGGIQGSTLNFRADISDSRVRRFATVTTNSAAINNIASLQHYTPLDNLLDPSNSADLLIITHPSFVSYAAEIAKMRSQGAQPLKGKVVTTRDIYFWFNSGVQDPAAIRDFIRYAYYQWADPRPSYVLLFGDGHYDYRNIALPDTNRVPPYEISYDYEIDSRETDNFYADIDFNSTDFTYIVPDLAIGRLPAESEIDAARIVDKLQRYESERSRDGWQTVLTFVGDDEVTSLSNSEWIHQRQSEWLATLPVLDKFIKRRIYLSAYNSVPGGFGRVKPEANQAIIDQLNEGTLMINYVGHGSPREWAHENVLNMSRDLNRIQNEGKLAFWIAATCDFGRYDDPEDPSFTEALIWEENRGAIGLLSSSRLVYSNENYGLTRNFLLNLFPGGAASRRLGDAMLLTFAIEYGENDQKYHLFADPTMYLADPRKYIAIDRIEPDTLKALSKVTVDGRIEESDGGDQLGAFNGGAVLIANDARYDSVNTGGPDYYTVIGPRIFKGEISVGNGAFNGSFIVPKSIRYHNRPTGRLTVFAWDENSGEDALGYADNLLFNGTVENLDDHAGPVIDVYFKDQEQFNQGDLVPAKPVIMAEIGDENGINLTGEIGHTIELKVDDAQPINITSFFAYDRDSYSDGKLSYNLENLTAGEHNLQLQAWDNLNNPTRQEIRFRVAEAGGLALQDVVNYPNPFAGETNFTFQAQGISPDAEVRIRIYTVTGRLIRTLEGLGRPQPGFNYYEWDGRDSDGDALANGVYVYKVVLKDGSKQKEVIEKLVILK